MTADTPTPAPVAVGCDGNRELLAAVCNLLMEAREHTRGLEALYYSLRELKDAAPKSWGHRLVEEFRRHEEQTARNLVGLQALVE